MYPDKGILLDSVNKYMTAYAAQEDEQARLRAQQRQEPDAEGFVTVTRGGRTNPASQETARAIAQKQKEKAKQKGFDDFYRFQGRERRKEKAKELMRKFDEDKEKLRVLKQSRSFKVPSNVFLELRIMLMPSSLNELSLTWVQKKVIEEGHRRSLITYHCGRNNWNSDRANYTFKRPTQGLSGQKL